MIKNEIIMLLLILILIGTFIYYCLFLKKKADINRYYYYSYRNEIHIKMWHTIFINSRKRTYEFNKIQMMKGFCNLPKGEIFKCTTHQGIINILEKREQRGQIEIIKKEAARKTINVGCLERLLRKKAQLKKKRTGI